MEINKENVLAAYVDANEESKRLLENLFGIEVFKPKDVTERIKTFEDACGELGEDHPFVVAYRNIEDIDEYGQDIEAYIKLRIICAALNEGWKPEFNEDETRYYPYFMKYIDTGKVVYKGSGWADAVGGIAYTFPSRDASYAYMSVGYHLVFKTKELAEYAGKQFTCLWEDYLFGKEEEQ